MTRLGYAPQIRLDICIYLLSSLLVCPVVAQPLFTKDASDIARRIAPFPARSLTVGDYNNDGWPDVFMGENTRQGRIALLHNDGGVGFIDQSAALQTPLAGRVRGAGSLFGDYDNDGDLDLFIPHWEEANMLMRNDQGVFREVTQESGFDRHHCT
jgi:hypothetical protein